MRLSQAWIIAAKDFATFSKKRNIIYSTIGVPLIVAVLLPLVLTLAVHRQGLSQAVSHRAFDTLLPAFTFLWLVLAGVIPTTIASYTIVGEKVEGSLEPLLATPTTDGEILVGKGLAAFLPPIAAIIGGSIVFMVLTDAVTRSTLGHLFFPNWNAVIVLFVMVPLAALMSVEWSVIISARVSDVRVAQQIGGVIMLPFAGIYVSGEIGLIALGVAKTLLLIAAIMLVVDLLLLNLAEATFRREEILTKWK